MALLRCSVDTPAVYALPEHRPGTDSADPGVSPPPRKSLLDLPTEIRLNIWGYVLTGRKIFVEERSSTKLCVYEHIRKPAAGPTDPFAMVSAVNLLSLPYACKTICHEARPLLFKHLSITVDEFQTVARMEPWLSHEDFSRYPSMNIQMRNGVGRRFTNNRSADDFWPGRVRVLRKISPATTLSVDFPRHVLRSHWEDFMAAMLLQKDAREGSK
ncbi:hypothetical protein BDZ85DRAFT_41023 [Elsinoe ampelina]|uniref:Uncharacterized protein n=1 Tax=Elsinoe ampelina TaxID=302913 RepID=A0A6A6G2E6_9PEZI|nr:hypothetical protein BDZ85DRAFT_41023 [Elsinoe ampelina]